MNLPAVSIIVPVFNAYKYLARCIDSILKQTFTDWECLLIDDGSTDGSGVLCDEYAQRDSRIRVFHKERGGVSSARNVGLEKARGEWLVFVDADDWIMPCHLADINQYKVDLVIFDFFRNNEVQQQDCTRIYDYKDLINAIISEKIFGALWNKRFSTKLIRSIGLLFDEDVDFGEDVLFIVTLLNRSHVTFTFSKKCSYHYSEIENTLSRTYTNNIWQRRFIQFKKLQQILDDEYEDSLFQLYANIVWEAFSRGIIDDRNFYHLISNKKSSLLKRIDTGIYGKLCFVLALAGAYRFSQILITKAYIGTQGRI